MIGESGVLTFTSRPTRSDLLWNSMALMRESAFSLVLGAFMTSTAVVGFLVSGWDLSLPITLVLGVALLSGGFATPFVGWMLWKRADLVLAETHVRADAETVATTSGATSATQSWSVYRRAHESRRAFVLDTGAGMAALLSKTGMTADEVDRFRALLVEVGLLRTDRSLRHRLRRVVWVGAGLAGTVALVFGSVALSTLTANVRLDLDVVVSERSAIIVGSTDLPDGAYVEVEVFHLDGWERLIDDPSAYDEWLDWNAVTRATVRSGAFQTTVDLAGWPTGRGIAVVWFWVDAEQPPEVRDRFGRDGVDLRGPDVVDLGDGTLGIYAEAVFDIAE